MAEIATKRKILSTEQKIAAAFRKYLREGGTSDSPKLRAAAFDRIADKFLKEDS